MSIGESLHAGTGEPFVKDSKRVISGEAFYDNSQRDIREGVLKKWAGMFRGDAYGDDWGCGGE